ncbi:MAG: hypothetical protein Q9M13_00590, partial [Mariprofundales bacterium]|nr:hypothetical protein [Mariprofundales bacterium]
MPSLSPFCSLSAVGSYYQEMTPKKLISRYFPDPDRIRQHKRLQCFGSLLIGPGLWQLNRNSVAKAFAVGVFSAFM